MSIVLLKERERNRAAKVNARFHSSPVTSAATASDNCCWRASSLASRASPLVCALMSTALLTSRSCDAGARLLPAWRAGGFRQGPSFQTLMSLLAGRRTVTGNQPWQIRGWTPVLSTQSTHAFQRRSSRRQSRIRPGAGGAWLPWPNRAQQWCQRFGWGHASLLGGCIDTHAVLT